MNKQKPKWVHHRLLRIRQHLRRAISRRVDVGSQPLMPSSIVKPASPPSEPAHSQKPAMHKHGSQRFAEIKMLLV